MLQKTRALLFDKIFKSELNNVTKILKQNALIHFLSFAAFAFPCTIAGKATKPTCDDFSKDAEFKEQNAIGTWHLHGPEIGKGSKDAKCLQFSAVDEKVY